MTGMFDHGIAFSRKLLRGELSAVETYNRALEKFTRDPARALLRSIRADHQDSATFLGARIASHAPHPRGGYDLWGKLAKGLDGFAELFGETRSLMAFEAGEAAGIDDCLSALADPDVIEEIKTAIRTVVLPRLRRHVDTLRTLRAG